MPAQESSLPLRFQTERDGKVTRITVEKDPAFSDSLKDTQKQTANLLDQDREIRALADRIKLNPSPKIVAEFVAVAEQKIEKFRYDLPNWAGNDFFVYMPGKGATQGGNEIVKGEFMQQACVGEAAHAATIIMTLRDKGYLPKDTTWEYISMAEHWAPVIYQEYTSAKDSPGFVIDPWLASPGKPAPTFVNREQWEGTVNFLSAEEKNIIGKQRKQFYQQLSGPSGLQAVDYTAEEPLIFRKFDNKFLETHSPDIFDNWKNNNNEAKQDFIVAKYFLGKNPILPASEMNDAYFTSLRDRVAHIIEKDSTNLALKKTDLSVAAIKQTSNFAELKPMLEKFYTAYNVDIKLFDSKTEKRTALPKQSKSSTPMSPTKDSVSGIILSGDVTTGTTVAPALPSKTGWQLS